MKCSKGFTLVEILIAVAVFAVVMTMVTSIFVAGLRTRAEGATSLALEREGSLILERIMRGLYGKGGLREADSGTVSVSAGGTLIQFTVDRNAFPTKTRADDTTSMIYLVGGKVYYRPDVNSSATVCISGSEGTVDLLRFTPTATGVDIVITLRADLPATDRRAFIHLTKSVTARN
jgi:prepilin-type N-terminal cleavage/methylation domain-containing protein